MASTLIQDAVIRNLQALGESPKRLSPELKSAHPEVEWREAAALRHVLVYDYLGVDPDIVWSVVEYDLPRLKEAVNRLLSAGGSAV